ncbi:hypothetical protein EYF80_023865 [Liparis tanakae]|uniref:Uncharacterized protein n=1 Tax=Liparis tanakae TaxID=230148 RepID=A0A4Z2HKN3_9TELE|nr:hypothetical protein EYF80_023865 [Liparis tanakae]
MQFPPAPSLFQYATTARIEDSSPAALSRDSSLGSESPLGGLKTCGDDRMVGPIHTFALGPQFAKSVTA